MAKGESQAQIRIRQALYSMPLSGGAGINLPMTELTFAAVADALERLQQVLAQASDRFTEIEAELTMHRQALRGVKKLFELIQKQPSAAGCNRAVAAIGCPRGELR